MDSARIKGLMDLLAESDLLELSLTEGDSTLRLFKQAGQGVTSVAPAVIAASPKTAPAPATAIEIKASLYGVLHLTPAVGEPPFVSVGQAIDAGQTVAVIEAMKMFHPVKAKVAGKLVEILAQAGVEVEAGQALFRLG
ncbi:acetyl-CoA carboxylase biotin carboxyl carrier protein [Pseudomonas poae]|uniref:Biotin carboxyl carrier protein of acetyl-CoA carboxylase n=1 Tax=Pseudomonas poae TaxID=200451 RepID=A0A2S9EHE2_9PSED|nr:acetyl-CoA carboxylase biotin carboxyl carrier protein subunit [Pseudomonas poae]PRA25923.1 acetyl-CoA carboxylase biotin carboxyl carrier protein subunit [Pseudomonas poae]PRC14609.1 acetyl-CoA carboxylase biotin carboxyl carrier protein subunit [Pseudomonas poae]